MNIKSSICGIQHTCINFLNFSYRFNYKNRVLACFQTRPHGWLQSQTKHCIYLFIFKILIGARYQRTPFSSSLCSSAAPQQWRRACWRAAKSLPAVHTGELCVVGQYFVTGYNQSHEAVLCALCCLHGAITRLRNSG